MLATKEHTNPIVRDGQKLAQAQEVVNSLINKLEAGNFWSAEDIEKILESSKEKLNKIIRGTVQ